MSNDIALIIEASMWDVEAGAVPADLTVIDQSDRLLWSGAADTPYANKVVRATFPDSTLEQGIDEILSFFCSRGKRFSWWVGPSSAPDSLPGRLEARGLTLMDRYEGVALPMDASPAIWVNPAVTIVPVEDEATVRAMVGVNGLIWGYSEADRERMVADRMAYLNGAGRRGGFLLAQVAGENAGVASYRFSADGRAIYLNGAATVPQVRKQGVFTALVAHRLELARRRGAELACCLARAGTSAPVLLKLGFARHLTMPVYTG